MSTRLPEPLAAYFAGHNNPEEVGELLAGGPSVVSRHGWNLQPTPALGQTLRTTIHTKGKMTNAVLSGSD
jgi:hypothetical protein